jgi:hypothetical protein
MSVPRFDVGFGIECGLCGINRLELVSLNFTSWNQLDGWLRAVESLRRAA